MLKSNWISIVWITFNSNPLFPNEKRIWYQLQRFNIKMMRGFCVSCRCSVRPQKFHSAEQEIQFIVGAVFSFEAEWVKLCSPWLMRPIHRGRLPRVPRCCRGRPGGPGGGGEGPLRARVADLHPAHPHHHQQAIRGDRQPGDHCTLHN